MPICAFPIRACRASMRASIALATRSPFPSPTDGRGGDADLRIPDPSLSRIHARFDRDGDTLAVTDVDSRNGTYVEGQRISERKRLKSGDHVTLGNVVLRFAVEDASDIKASRKL